MLTADDLLNHANNAYQHNVSREEFARAGVSRLYYACYHYCVNTAGTSCGALPSDQGVGAGHHQKLMRRLRGFGKRDDVKAPLVTLANMLQKALDLRVDADYHLDRKVGADEYAIALKFSREIKKKAEEISRILSN